MRELYPQTEDALLLYWVNYNFDFSNFLNFDNIDNGNNQIIKMIKYVLSLCSTSQTWF